MAKVEGNGDDYYQDYMMVLEVFDKMEPGEQGMGGPGGNNVDQQQGGVLSSATDAFDAGAGSFAADGNVFGQSVAGGTMEYGAETTGRSKRGANTAAANSMDMDRHAFGGLAGDGLLGFGGQGLNQPYLDQQTGMSVNTHLVPANAPATSTSTSATSKKRGANTVDDLLSHVALAKQRRRERNKVLARKTRIKKKVELEQLKNQIDHLTTENTRLRSLVAEAGIEYHEDKSALAASINATAGGLEEMMQGIANDSSIFSSVTSGTLKSASEGLAQYPALSISSKDGNASGADSSVNATTGEGITPKTSENDETGNEASGSGDNSDEDDKDDKNPSLGGKHFSYDQNNSGNSNSNNGSHPARVTRTSARNGSTVTSSGDNTAQERKTRRGQGKSGSDSADSVSGSERKITAVSEIIDVDSASSKDVEHSFSLPTAADDESDESEDQIIRCVVVEDSVVQAKLMCNHLLSLKSNERVMKVYRVSSAEAAVDLLNNKGGANADLWFIDQNLGASDDAMKGSDLITHIRKHPESSGTTVVGVTTNPVAHFAEMSAAGVDIVWGKEDIDGKGMTNKLSRLLAPRATVK